MDGDGDDGNVKMRQHIWICAGVFGWLVGWQAYCRIYANRYYCCYFEVYLFIQFPNSNSLEFKGFYLLLIRMRATMLIGFFLLLSLNVFVPLVYFCSMCAIFLVNFCLYLICAFSSMVYFSLAST